MKLVLCSFLFALFGVNQAYVIQRRVPVGAFDADLFRDILNLTMSIEDNLVYQATVNEFGDRLIANLDKMIVRQQLDPFILPDVYKGYWWGNVQVNNIQFTGLATLYRPGEDVIMSYTHENKQLQLDLPLSFKDLKFSAHCSASLLYVGPSGDLTGEIPDMVIKTSLVIDYNFNQAFIRVFEIPDSGHISIHFNMFIIATWMYNLISDAITAIFHDEILAAISEVLQGMLASLMDVINTILQTLLG